MKSVQFLSIFIFAIVLFCQPVHAQQQQGGTLGGYGELHYNDVLYNDNGMNSPGRLDFHRFILYASYRFNDWVSFYSELELEHTLLEVDEGGEVALEQAFVDLSIKPEFGVRAGLLLVPVGIVNPIHEPPTFHGVERPNVERYIIPSTWRESGIGVYGKFQSGWSYQAYAMAGLKPNGITGGNGIRGARQNGFESTLGNFGGSARIDYQANLNLKFGVSYFFSTLRYERDGDLVVKIPELENTSFNMIEGHIQYTSSRLEARGLLAFSGISNVDELNTEFGNGAGKSQFGGYAELAYDLLPSLTGKLTEQQLFVFGRFETYDTQLKTDLIADNAENERYEYTFGFTYKPVSQVAFKADYQLLTSAGIKEIHMLNLGVGYNF
ncbi:MAG: hypothetical protein R3211_03125 [Balneolaceae bacterium]|nr:hypothetical protein [Balneolaceae bacterium]